MSTALFFFVQRICWVDKSYHCDASGMRYSGEENVPCRFSLWTTVTDGGSGSGSTKSEAVIFSI